MSNQERFLAEFKAFLSIPSVSTLPENKGDVLHAAHWLASRMTDAGLEHAEICETGGHPVVYADWLHAEGAPTILLYGHYDVQPADPLELWQSPPFEPEVRGDRLYARGASDMKGNVLVFIHAVEAHLRTSGRLPLNVKLIVEGEEEIGSPSLPKWIEENQAKLACDYAASSDSAQISRDLPTVIVGTKGMCGLQVDIKTGRTDLHSGLAGGVVRNALHVLSDMISSMHDPDGRVTVAGFYDHVANPSDDERQMARRIPVSEDMFRQAIGATELVHEPGWSVTECTWFRPTLEVNGMWGGFQGDGTKTVIPCEAHAKITCRLAANQDPDKIRELIKAHILAHTPSGVEATVTPLPGKADPYLMPETHPALKAADAALEEVKQAAPIHMRMGATVPVLGTFKNLLGVGMVSLGFSGLADGLHAPNESVDLVQFYSGGHIYCSFFEHLAK